MSPWALKRKTDQAIMEIDKVAIEIDKVAIEMGKVTMENGHGLLGNSRSWHKWPFQITV